VKKVQKLPDPLGIIKRIKARLSVNCAVKKSPFCEIIISMRLQGIDYRSIEKWLIDQGEEYRISSPTIFRNLKNTKLEVTLPYAEELAEKWGGRIDLDHIRELSGQVLAQRKRLDRLQRREEEHQVDRPHYFDRRIRQERELLTNMIKALGSLIKSPLELADEARAAEAYSALNTLKLSDDAVAVLKDMLISGELSYGDEFEIPPDATIN